MQEVAEWRDLTPEQELAVESAWNELALELKSQERVSRARELRSYYKALPEPPTYELDEQGRILSKEVTPKPVRQPIQKPQVKPPKAPTLQEARKPLEKPLQASSQREESKSPQEPEARKGPPKQANQASTHEIISRINDPEELEQRISVLESQKANLNPEQLAQLEATQQALRYRKDEIETGYHHGEFGKVKDTLDKLEQENPDSPEYREALEKHNKYAEAFNKLPILKRAELHPTINKLTQQLASTEVDDSIYNDYMEYILELSPKEIAKYKQDPNWKTLVQRQFDDYLLGNSDMLKQATANYNGKRDDKKILNLKRERKVITDTIAAHNKIRDAAHHVFFKSVKKQGPTWKLVKHGNLEQEHEVPVTESLNFFNNFLNTTKQVGNTSFASRPSDEPQRSRHNQPNRGNSYIDLGGVATASTVAHELGHKIERGNPAILRASLKLYEQIFDGEKPQPLAKVYPEKAGAYSPDEIGRKDKMDKVFGKRAYYFGKDYGGRTTEFISMLTEEAHRDMGSLARRWPEGFAFWAIAMTDPEHLEDIKPRQARISKPVKQGSLRQKYGVGT